MLFKRASFSGIFEERSVAIIAKALNDLCTDRLSSNLVLLATCCTNSSKTETCSLFQYASNSAGELMRSPENARPIRRLISFRLSSVYQTFAFTYGEDPELDFKLDFKLDLKEVLKRSLKYWNPG